MANPRYYELKHEGGIYTKKYEIDEILLENDLNWFFDCEVENMRIEIQKETLIINSGIFYNGVFEYGVIRDVDWRNGKVMNGVIYNGIYKKITVEQGIIFNGTFLKGDVLKGDIRGGEFKDVNISKQTKQGDDNGQVDAQEDVQVQSQQPQVQIQPQVQGQEVQSQVQVDGQIQSQGQTIQSQVQKTQESNMKNNLLKFDLFVEKMTNEDLASNHFDYDVNGAEEKYISEVENDDYEEEDRDIWDDNSKGDDAEKIEKIIEDYQEKLEEFEPPFKYKRSEVDSQKENAGIVDSTVWISFEGVYTDSFELDELEEDFIKRTDFDEVEMLSTDDAITYSINVYNWE